MSHKPNINGRLMLTLKYKDDEYNFSNKTRILSIKSVELFFQTLHWNNFVFNTGVLSFGVFSNSDQVAIFVSSWESFQTDAWSNVSVQTESFPQHQVHTWVTGSDWGSQWSFQTASGDVHGFFAWVWDFPFSGSVLNGHDVSSLPVDWCAGGVEDFHYRIRNFWTDTVTWNHGDEFVFGSVDGG